eukprot:gene1031-1396_t
MDHASQADELSAILIECRSGPGKTEIVPPAHGVRRSGRRSARGARQDSGPPWTDRSCPRSWPGRAPAAVPCPSAGRLVNSKAPARRIARTVELTSRPDVPTEVAIDEYVDVAKSFFEGAEPGFVNGALDGVARDIARLFRPLTRGAAGAFDLMDDAAVVPQRPGFDLVVTKDAIVAGVHFLEDDDAGRIGQRLARVNVSDLAAKGAEPFAAFLAVAWPRDYSAAQRSAFATGLGADLKTYGISLMGGDTVVTPGPFTA